MKMIIGFSAKEGEEAPTMLVNNVMGVSVYADHIEYVMKDGDEFKFFITNVLHILFQCMDDEYYNKLKTEVETEDSK